MKGFEKMKGLLEWKKEPGRCRRVPRHFAEYPLIDCQLAYPLTFPNEDSLLTENIHHKLPVKLTIDTLKNCIVIVLIVLVE